MTQGIKEVDPWIDERFAQLDMRNGSLADSLTEIAAEDPAFTPRPDPADVEELVVAAPVVEEPVLAAPAAEPERIVNSDGTAIEIAHTNKGWKATIDSGTGAQPEVFYGATKDEMWHNIARGKANATKQIRDLNRKIKLGGEPQVPAAVPTQVSSAPAQGLRALTADEAFEIKTQLEANPDLALERWFQLKTGLSLGDLVSMAKQAPEGRQANLALNAETVARDFVSSHPDYYVSGKNFAEIVAWVAKNKMGVVATEQNFNSLYNQLVESGHWTAKNLDAAFTDLSESGLLEVEPVESDEEEQAAPPAPQPTPVAQPAPTDGRIVRTVRQPRAGLGTRPSAHAARPPEPSSPAVEDLDNLSDAEIKGLLDGVRRTRLVGRRS